MTTEPNFPIEVFLQNAEKIWSLGFKGFQKLNNKVRLELKSAYTNYLTKCHAKYSLAKSFFIRDQSVDLYSYYVPIGLNTRSFEIDTPTFASCHKVSRHSLIMGQGGTGKSVLMRHLFLDCLKSQKYVPVLGPVDNRACSFCCFLIQECKRGGFDEGRSFGPFR